MGTEGQNHGILIIYPEQQLGWGWGQCCGLRWCHEVSKGETSVVIHNKLTNVPASVKMHLLVQPRCL